MNTIAFLNAYSQGKSGGDMCFIEIFKRIKNQQLTIVTSQLGQNLCKDNGLSASFHITSSETHFENIIWTYVKRTIKAIQITSGSKNLDVIYATSDWFPDILPSVILKMKNPQAKFIAKIFHLIPQKRVLSSFAQSCSFFLIKQFADIIVVDNTLLKKELKRQGFNPARLFVNYPAINQEKIQQAKPIRTYDATYLGRIHESKGIIELIEMWGNIVKKLPKAKLGIIGSGEPSFEKKIKELISRNKLDKNIDMLGHLENNKAYGLVKGSSVFIFPSHEEGFGMAIGEALACVVPVVTYDLPIFTETFKKALITAPRFDTITMEKNILDVLQNSKKYTDLVKQGNKLASKFTWEKASQIELHLMQS